MHTLLDDYAQRNALKDVSPKVKLLLGLGSILLCISSSTPVAPIFVAASMSAIIVGMAKIPARFYAKLLLIPLSFALLSSAVVAFMHGTGAPIFSVDILGFSLAIRTDGANLALLLIARTLGGMCSLFFIALTTPMIEIFSVLKSVRIPEVLLELSMMIYRYIFVFLDQAAMIHHAQTMRLGDSSLTARVHSFAMLCSVLFLQAWEQGERLIVAMDARCYDGRLDLMHQSGRTTPKSVAFVMIYLSAVLAVAVLSREFQLL
jgi:cobalt/nickel transport system permease protein